MALKNGRLPADALVRLSWYAANKHRLRADAAAALERLAAEFLAHFGYELYITDGYRTYAQQVFLKAVKGRYAARPGTSNHGWGVAIDVGSGVNQDWSAEHRWFEQNAPRHGWRNPWWATDSISSNGMYEPWHWEYSPEHDVVARQVSAERDLDTDLDIPNPNGELPDALAPTVQEDDIMATRIRLASTGATYAVCLQTGLFSGIPTPEFNTVLGDGLAGPTRNVGQREFDVIRHQVQVALERLTGKVSQVLPDGSIGLRP